MLKNFILQNTAIPSLSKGLDVYALREKVISANIANIETPGYKRLKVSFEDRLKSAVVNSISGEVTDAKHIPIGSSSNPGMVNAKVIRDPSSDLTSGINNVNVEEEMVEMVKNQVRYMYATRMARREFSALRAGITGRYSG